MVISPQLFACVVLPGVFFNAHVWGGGLGRGGVVVVGGAGYRPHETQLVIASEGDITVADRAVTPSARDDPSRERGSRLGMQTAQSQTQRSHAL